MDLEKIKEKIEKMSKFHQVEVLRLLNSDSSTVLNENKNGVFVNMSQLTDSMIEQLANYIAYVDDQQKNLQTQEHARVDLERQYFNTQHNSNKETTNVKISHGLKA
jgi:hypothetical protein